LLSQAQVLCDQRAFGLRSAAIAHVIHRITNPSHLLAPKRSVPSHPIREKLPGWSFCALQARIDPSGYDAGKKVKGKKAPSPRRHARPAAERAGASRS
jgi:hypothetical protein